MVIESVQMDLRGGDGFKKFLHGRHIGLAHWESPRIKFPSIFKKGLCVGCTLFMSPPVIEWCNTATAWQLAFLHSKSIATKTNWVDSCHNTTKIEIIEMRLAMWACCSKCALRLLKNILNLTIIYIMNRSIPIKIKDEARPYVKVWRGMTLLFHEIHSIWCIWYIHDTALNEKCPLHVSLTPQKAENWNQNDFVFSSNYIFHSNSQVAYKKIISNKSLTSACCYQWSKSRCKHQGRIPKDSENSLKELLT